MTAELFPGVSIVAKDARTLEVQLPEESGVMFPSIPEKLHGQEIPSFVLEWLVESDEIGMMVQEVLQAPTRSLCRIMPITSTKKQLHMNRLVRKSDERPAYFRPAGQQTAAQASRRPGFRSRN